MEWDERDLRVIQILSKAADRIQTHNARPPTRFRVARRDDVRTSNGETARVLRGGVERIRKCLLPQFKALDGREPNGKEGLLSGGRNPRFGDEAAILDLGFFVGEVDDDIEHLSWERWTRHHHFGAEASHS